MSKFGIARTKRAMRLVRGDQVLTENGWREIQTVSCRMTTTELEIGTIEVVEETPFEEPPDMVAHLYDNSFWRMLDPNHSSLCGLRPDEDPHSCMHEREGEKQLPTYTGDGFCSRCGAPICIICHHRFERIKESDGA